MQTMVKMECEEKKMIKNKLIINKYPTYGEIDAANNKQLKEWYFYLRKTSNKLERKKWYYICIKKISIDR